MTRTLDLLVYLNRDYAYFKTEAGYYLVTTITVSVGTEIKDLNYSQETYVNDCRDMFVTPFSPDIQQTHTICSWLSTPMTIERLI